MMDAQKPHGGMLPATVAAVIGMIPEGLVLLTSTALALGVKISP